MPYFGVDPARNQRAEYHIDTGLIYTVAFNQMLGPCPAEMLPECASTWGLDLSFSIDSFWFCITGFKKAIIRDVYGQTAASSMEIFSHYASLVEQTVKRNHYSANVFMVLENETKQMAVIFSSNEAPKCSPEELAAEITALGQKVYEQYLFHENNEYCNIAALSKELHGYADIRAGYLQARKLNDLSFFRMEPEVLTSKRIEKLRNAADYRTVMSECHQLQLALDAGNISLCKKRLKHLYLDTIKNSFRWPLLHDALSFCKHMLELRCTARGLTEVDPEILCTQNNYLCIEEIFDALWPILKQLCSLAQEQGCYQELILQTVYYIKLHYSEDISLADIAAYVGVTPNYLSGTFQKEMGCSLREFITTERIEAAKKLLLNKSMRVFDVAEAVGIHDVKYFSRLFKKMTGTPPGEYRDCNQ